MWEDGDERNVKGGLGEGGAPQALSWPCFPRESDRMAPTPGESTVQPYTQDAATTLSDGF